MWTIIRILDAIEQRYHSINHSWVIRTNRFSNESDFIPFDNTFIPVSLPNKQPPTTPYNPPSTHSPAYKFCQSIPQLDT